MLSFTWPQCGRSVRVIDAVAGQGPLRCYVNIKIVILCRSPVCQQLCGTWALTKSAAAEALAAIVMPTPSGIPHDVLVHIMQHVPLTKRMSSCSLVQQSWREAAAEATTSITLTDIPSATGTALVCKLATNSTSWAQHITSISLEQRIAAANQLEVALPQLACAKLLQLHLSGFILTSTATTQTSSGDSASADSSAADSSSEDSGAADGGNAESSSADSGNEDNSSEDSEDSSSQDSGAADSVGLVDGCPLVQELSLTSCWAELSRGSPAVMSQAMSFLTALTALTKLHLGPGVYVTRRGSDTLLSPNFGPLSALTGLQELRLVQPKQHQLQQLFRRSRRQQGQSQHNSQRLPSLTKLSILMDDAEYNISTTPGVYELSRLRALDLRGAEVGSVQQLSALSRLESLTLHSATNLSKEDIEAKSDCDNGSDSYDGYLHIADAFSTAADTGELLQLLPQLPRLTHLDLFGLAGSKAVVSQWTCLGRCTGLQVLRLQNLFMHRDSWPLMFAGAQFSRLRELCLTMYSTVTDCVSGRYMPMPPQVVQQMVDACPNLEVLHLCGDSILSSSNKNCLPRVLEAPRVSLTPLAQLQHLTNLRVYSMRSQVCLCTLFSGHLFYVCCCVALACCSQCTCCSKILLAVNVRPLAQLEHKLSSTSTPQGNDSLRLQVFSDLWRLANLRHLVVGGRVPDLALVQLSALTNLTSFRRLELEYDDDCENWDDSVKHLALSHSQVGEGVRVGKWHYVGPATVGGTITVKHAATVGGAGLQTCSTSCMVEELCTPSLVQPSSRQQFLLQGLALYCCSCSVSNLASNNLLTITVWCVPCE